MLRWSTHSVSGYPTELTTIQEFQGYRLAIALRSWMDVVAASGFPEDLSSCDGYGLRVGLEGREEFVPAETPDADGDRDRSPPGPSVFLSMRKGVAEPGRPSRRSSCPGFKRHVLIVLPRPPNLLKGADIFTRVSRSWMSRRASSSLPTRPHSASVRRSPGRSPVSNPMSRPRDPGKSKGSTG